MDAPKELVHDLRNVNGYIAYMDNYCAENKGDREALDNLNDARETKRKLLKLFKQWVTEKEAKDADLVKSVGLTPYRAVE